MRVAALYDVHGNLPALEAVLDALSDASPDLIVVGGDVVPGPMPSESLAALLSLSIPVRFIHGNGERDALAAHRGEDLSHVPPAFHDAMRWVAKELSPEHLTDMAGWPLTLRLDHPTLGSVLFCHATPRDVREIFTRVTPEERLRPVFDAAGASVVVCGHTHMQFDRSVGNVRVLNAGSVGMPFGEPGAYWALLGGEIELRHTPYDLPAAAERMGKSGYPATSAFDVLHPPAAAEMLEVFEAAALRL
ncbi:MAG: metallophosphoesterase family protein [Gemmatimonadota bacterium]